jgi:hypothetical protein
MTLQVNDSHPLLKTNDHAVVKTREVENKASEKSDIENKPIRNFSWYMNDMQINELPPQELEIPQGLPMPMMQDFTQPFEDTVPTSADLLNDRAGNPIELTLDPINVDQSEDAPALTTLSTFDTDTINPAVIPAPVRQYETQAPIEIITPEIHPQTNKDKNIFGLPSDPLLDEAILADELSDNQAIILKQLPLQNALTRPGDALPQNASSVTDKAIQLQATPVITFGPSTAFFSPLMMDTALLMTEEAIPETGGDLESDSICLGKTVVPWHLKTFDERIQAAATTKNEPGNLDMNFSNNDPSDSFSQSVMGQTIVQGNTEAFQKVVSELRERLNRAFNLKNTSLNLTVKHATLGTVEIDITVENGKAKTVFQSETKAMQSVLTQHRRDIAAILKEADLECDQASIIIRDKKEK